MNLVAGAVTELTADHVTVVDQNGQLLSGQDDDTAQGGTDRQFKYVQQLETNLRDKVHNILLPTVGANRFTAEVAADVDFTWVEETEELFNPDQPALRSEQTMNEQRVGDASDGGVPGAVRRTTARGCDGAADAAEARRLAQVAPTTPPSRSRSQATRNFELDRTISHTRHQVGRVTRLTVSVLVDDLPAPGAEDGQVTYVPWKEADLERLTALVKNAIGYNAARGDTVTVVNSPFLEEHMEPVEPVPFWTQTWFIDVVKKVVGGLLVLALVLGLLRPLYRNLSRAGSSAVSSDAAMARLVAMRGTERSQFYAGLDSGQVTARRPVRISRNWPRCAVSSQRIPRASRRWSNIGCRKMSEAAVDNASGGRKAAEGQSREKMPSVDRAAVLLLALGEDDAARVLKHLDPREVQRVGSAMASLRSVNMGQISGRARRVSRHGDGPVRHHDRRVGVHPQNAGQRARRRQSAHAGRPDPRRQHGRYRQAEVDGRAHRRRLHDARAPADSGDRAVAPGTGAGRRSARLHDRRRGEDRRAARASPRSNRCRRMRCSN